MTMESQEGGGLAQHLRALRETTWPDVRLTQAQLALAFSAEQPVVAATISTWESATNPKTPNAERLRAYARFFATPRSLEGGPRLIPEDELTESEQTEFRALANRLLGLVNAPASPIAPTEDRLQQERPGGSFTFSDGPVTIICPDAPDEYLGPLAQRDDPNYAKLQRYADLDALIEIHGHVRAANPALNVYHRLASEAWADDLTTHVILIGGVAWNEATRRFLKYIRQVPIEQDDVPGTGRDPFSVLREDGSREVFDTQWAGPGDDAEMTSDVGSLYRLPNPFNLSRTLTICNGIHSRGVLGAVRCLTDASVRTANEQYLARRFPNGRFAMLLQVPVVARATLSPDLQNPDSRLYEWPETGASA